jgi:hypothetical protein
MRSCNVEEELKQILKRKKSTRETPADGNRNQLKWKRKVRTRILRKYMTHQ